MSDIIVVAVTVVVDQLQPDLNRRQSQDNNISIEKIFPLSRQFRPLCCIVATLRFDRLTARRIETNADSIEISNLRFRPDLLVSGHLGGVPL